ncbi:unnamed protein product [Schistosoma curassoni]|uniref:ATP synthase F0 subunit 8 n=1 Tax=Schistosoma curassoni TaxID=6186 RepID=A0A183JNF9_9TREM|nr:unnamed protein product [Schistosoma curassoni]
MNISNTVQISSGSMWMLQYWCTFILIMVWVFFFL